MPERQGARLCRASLPRLPAELRPRLDGAALSVGIVHLGVGAFHRAHQAYLTERASELSGSQRWGIAAVSERSPAAAEALSAQDGLYSLRTASRAGTSVQVLASLREAFFAGESPERLVARIADPAVSVVTITVTEKGYRHDPATGHLRGDDPEIVADAAGRPARTMVGQIARGLEARRRADAGPITICSCDNLPSNGALLRGLVTELVSLRPDRAGSAGPAARRSGASGLGAARSGGARSGGARSGGARSGGAGFDEGLAEWIEASASFPCSMVDRIVPATNAADLAEAARMLGLEDRAAIVAEPYIRWVIEDAFAGPRPPWELAGVELVEDVAPYETLKLRVLNASHSALAYLGALSGYETIAEAATDPGLEGFVRRLVDEEVAPGLVLPGSVELGAYRDEVLQRFANPVLRHRCTQVAQDGSQKLPQRLLATVREALHAGRDPRLATLVVAAWALVLARREDDEGRPLEVGDPLEDRVRALVGGKDAAGGNAGEGSGDGRAEGLGTADRLLELREVFGEDLALDERFRDLLAESFALLWRAPAHEVAGSMAG